jgi:hypothetical protein
VRRGPSSVPKASAPFFPGESEPPSEREGTSLTTLAAPHAAVAGTFDGKGVEVTRGESEVAVGAAWQHGFPVNSDHLRQNYEVSYAYGLASWFKAGMKLGFEQPDNEKVESTYAGVEAQAVLINPSTARFGLAWYTGVDFGLAPGASDVLTLGPLISIALAKELALTLNPLFQKSWDSSTPGIDFNYAWQLKRTINDNVAIGLEGYGTIAHLGNWPSVTFQEHRVGPVLILAHELGGAGGSGLMRLGSGALTPGQDKTKIELQLGVLFGADEAEPPQAIYRQRSAASEETNEGPFRHPAALPRSGRRLRCSCTKQPIHGHRYHPRAAP